MRHFRVFALIIVLMLVVSACAEDWTIVNCNEWVSLRETTSTGSGKRAEVPLGSTVSDCVDAANGFIGCSFNGVPGYILGQYVADPNMPCHEYLALVNGMSNVWGERYTLSQCDILGNSYRAVSPNEYTHPYAVLEAAVFDINNDGIPELFLREGEVEMNLYVFTVRDGKVWFTGYAYSDNQNGTEALEIFSREDGTLVAVSEGTIGSGGGNCNFVYVSNPDTLGMDDAGFRSYNYVTSKEFYIGRSQVSELQYTGAKETFFTTLTYQYSIEFEALGTEPVDTLRRILSNWKPAETTHLTLNLNASAPTNQPLIQFGPAPTATPAPVSSSLNALATAHASSTLAGNKYDVSPSKIIDNNSSTAWSSNSTRNNQWLQLNFTVPRTVTSFNMINGYAKSYDIWDKNSRVASMSLYVDEVYVASFNVQDNMNSQSFTLPNPVTGSTFRFTFDTTTAGWKYQDLCVSELTLMGY